MQSKNISLVQFNEQLLSSYIKNMIIMLNNSISRCQHVYYLVDGQKICKKKITVKKVKMCETYARKQSHVIHKLSIKYKMNMTIIICKEERWQKESKSLTMHVDQRALILRKFQHKKIIIKEVTHLNNQNENEKNHLHQKRYTAFLLLNTNTREHAHTHTNNNTLMRKTFTCFSLTTNKKL